jgi:nucleoside-diphosphate-sugar epimerase
MTDKHILITGGAGYIGSLLVSELLRRNYRVTVVDNLLFGGESLLGFFRSPNFYFVKADVTQEHAIKNSLKDTWQKPDAIVHLAALVGFPFCQAVGEKSARKNNVEAVAMVYSQAVELGVERFMFTSTCNVYGYSPDGRIITEESPLNPQSLYAQTKVEAEEYLLTQKDSSCAPLIFRLATLYGISPRPRFDLLINQFILDLHIKHKLWIYTKGNSRSFIHVYDTVCGIIAGLNATVSSVRGEIFNLATQNFKKYDDTPDLGDMTQMYKRRDEIDSLENLLKKYFPNGNIEHQEDITFGGDINDISLSFEKMEQSLRFKGTLTVEDGIKEVKHALDSGLVSDPYNQKYRNALPFIAQ